MLVVCFRAIIVACEHGGCGGGWVRLEGRFTKSEPERLTTTHTNMKCKNEGSWVLTGSLRLSSVLVRGFRHPLHTVAFPLLAMTML